MEVDAQLRHERTHVRHISFLRLGRSDQIAGVELVVGPQYSVCMGRLYGLRQHRRRREVRLERHQIQHDLVQRLAMDLRRRERVHS